MLRACHADRTARARVFYGHMCVTFAGAGARSPEENSALSCVSAPRTSTRRRASLSTTFDSAALRPLLSHRHASGPYASRFSFRSASVSSRPSCQRSVPPPRIEYLGVLRPACVRTPRSSSVRTRAGSLLLSKKIFFFFFFCPRPHLGRTSQVGGRIPSHSHPHLRFSALVCVVCYAPVCARVIQPRGEPGFPLRRLACVLVPYRPYVS